MSRRVSGHCCEPCNTRNISMRFPLTRYATMKEVRLMTSSRVVLSLPGRPIPADLFSLKLLFIVLRCGSSQRELSNDGRPTRKQSLQMAFWPHFNSKSGIRLVVLFDNCNRIRRKSTRGRNYMHINPWRLP